MEQIYVTGHRNPDTDSIVSAMAYACLLYTSDAAAPRGTGATPPPGWATSATKPG